MDKRISARIALVAATLIWGTSFVILKNTLDSIPTLYVLAFRFSGAALLMFLVGIRRLSDADRSGYINGGLVLGVLLFAAYTLQTYGLVYTTPGKNAFLTSSYCIMVPFLHWAINGKKPDGRNISAAFICVIGMALVSLRDDFSAGLGELLTIGCGLFYGLHIIATAKYIANRNLALLSAAQFTVVALLSWASALVSGPFPADIPASAWSAVLYLCVMCTAVCFFLQAYGQRYTPESSVAVIMTLESVFGTLISLLFYNERLTARTLTGFALIFAAVLISETRPQGTEIQRS